MGIGDIVGGGLKAAGNLLSGGGKSGGGDADFGELQGIFDKAKADQLEITKISVEGNTGIAKFKEKPKI